MTISNEVIPAGSVILILGGSQFADGLILAARRLGFTTVLWAQPGDNPAAKSADYCYIAPYNCSETFTEMVRFANVVVTSEFENVPTCLLEELKAEGLLVGLDPELLKATQSRILEKGLVVDLGVGITKTIFVPAYAVIGDEVFSDMFPAILKRDRFGCSGQWHVGNPYELRSAIAEAGDGCVLEREVVVKKELSIHVARSPSGEISLSDIVQNEYQFGILRKTEWPVTGVSVKHRANINVIARDFASKLELEGTLVIRFIIDTNNNLLFNEMAPYPHNSFWGSVEAAFTSQFEQQIRAACNLPLGSLTFHAPFMVTNLPKPITEEFRLEVLRSKGSSFTDHRIIEYEISEDNLSEEHGHVTCLSP